MTPYLICSIAQKMPELREIVSPELHWDRYMPWPVQMRAAPAPSMADAERLKETEETRNYTT